MCTQNCDMYWEGAHVLANQEIANDKMALKKSDVYHHAGMQSRPKKKSQETPEKEHTLPGTRSLPPWTLKQRCFMTFVRLLTRMGRYQIKDILASASCTLKRCEGLIIACF